MRDLRNHLAKRNTGIHELCSTMQCMSQCRNSFAHSSPIFKCLLHISPTLHAMRIMIAPRRPTTIRISSNEVDARNPSRQIWRRIVRIRVVELRWFVLAKLVLELGVVAGGWEPGYETDGEKAAAGFGFLRGGAAGFGGVEPGRIRDEGVDGADLGEEIELDDGDEEEEGYGDPD